MYFLIVLNQEQFYLFIFFSMNDIFLQLCFSFSIMFLLFTHMKTRKTSSFILAVE